MGAGSGSLQSGGRRIILMAGRSLSLMVRYMPLPIVGFCSINKYISCNKKYYHGA
jgi:hypothetical protein